ncbi:MAG: hypothetical protein HYY25_14850, partial [Candidatus Wallbacteria bacterium]|nr:hypothetical protein [Candidatus Wallbacteria bacterium]
AKAAAQAEAQAEAQAKGTAPAETVVASETPVAGETPAAAPKKGGFWSGLKDWFTGKNTLAGKARAAAAEAKAQAAAETLPTAETPVETKASQTAKTGPASETAPAPKATVVEPTAPIAEIPAEPAVAKSPQVQKIEAINSEIASLRTRAHDLSSGLVKEGTFKNAGEAYRASEQSGASGKLAELHQVNENIRSLRTEKTGLAKPSSAPAAEPTPAGAPAAAETPAAGGAGNAAVSKALPPVLEAANANGFSVKFGQKTHDLGAMTAKQIEAETGGLISNENAQKIAETAKANGGKISVNDLSKLGLTDDAVSALRKGNTDAVAGQLQEARAKAVERFGAESEAVKKIDSSLEQLKQSQPAKSETAPAAPSKGMTELLSARTTQLDSVNAQIAKLESSTGLLAKFTKGKQLKALYEQKATLEKEIAGYKQDPQALETANKAYQQKHEKVFAEQAKQAGYLEVELAKVDPNSRYGRALQERINQIKGMPPESFAKQASNMFLIAAGTNIMLSLGRQLMNGEKPDLGAAIKGIATPQFLLGTAGAAIGAYAGSKFALSKMGLILTTKLGSFLPPVGRVFLQMLPAMAGGALGSTLLSGGFKEADWLQIGAETIGSTLGAALAMSLFPGMGIFGQISAGMMGAEAAKFILKMIRGDPKSETAEGGGQAGEPQVPGAEGAAAKASATVASFTEKDVEDTFNAMGIFYQRYLDSEKSGNYGDAAQYYEKYAALKARLDGMRNSSFQARAK